MEVPRQKEEMTKKTKKKKTKKKAKKPKKKLKQFLLIENNMPGYEGYDGEAIWVEAPDFATALENRYQEEAAELAVNVSPRGWPPKSVLFRLRLEAYEVTRYIPDAQQQFNDWEAQALVKIIKEEEQWRKEEPERKRQAKIAAVKKQAAALGLDCVEKK